MRIVAKMNKNAVDMNFYDNVYNSDMEIEILTSSDSILEFIANNKRAKQGFVVEASGYPTDAPENIEAFVIINRDQSGERVLVEYRPYDYFNYNYSYFRRAFHNEWARDWEKVSNINAYETYTPTSVEDNAEVSYIRTKNKRVFMSFSYTMPENYSLYENILICNLPESIRPRFDQVIMNCNSDELFAIIVYADGRVAARYFINPSSANFVMVRGIAWDINPFI